MADHETQTVPEFLGTNDALEGILSVLLHGLEDACEVDILSLKAPMVTPIDELLRDQLERSSNRQDGLYVVLETEGGFLEVVSRIVTTLRRHYPERIEFIVPNYAYSAGTVLALSGDELHMDYFSVLGPTDPQDRTKDGQLVPALGYVKRYKKLIEESQRRDLSTAELTILVEAFDQGRLEMYEHARDQAIALLTEWLPKYKFKNWSHTEKRNYPVTDKMKQRRAKEIAEKLSDTDRWHSHGMGISMEVLRRDVGLRVKDFESDLAIRKNLKNYNGLLMDYMRRLGHQGFIHSRSGLRWL
jgi:hypothetical protein